MTLEWGPTDLWLAIRENLDTGNFEHLSSGKIEVPSIKTIWFAISRGKENENCVKYHHDFHKGIAYGQCTSIYNYICEIVIA